jgi:hypothetical protein
VTGPWWDRRSRVAIIWAGICGAIVGFTADTRYSWWIVGVLFTVNVVLAFVARRRRPAEVDE